MKVAIAGAGRGIGAACARALKGNELWLCARTAAEVDAVARETGAQAIAADLSTDSGAEEFARAAGAVDLALICAGGAHRAVALDEAGRDLLFESFVQNALTPAIAAGALLRHGAKHVFFLSSLATRRPPMPGAAPYTAAKAALESLVRSFAEEGWPRARANAVCLGPVRTQLHDVAGTPREWVEQFPSPDEIAPLIIKAASLPGTGQIHELDQYLADVEPFFEPALEAEPGRRPSPRVREALRKTAETLHRYPRGAAGLAERLARLHGVPPECIALSGGGATELLERCLRAFCRPGDEVVSPFPTFEVLSALCSREGLRHKPIPARRGPDGLFAPRHEAGQLLAAAGPRTRLVYVATPDNPTGAVLPAEERAVFEEGPIPLVLDEAWSLELPLPMQPRAVHLRSLSKLHGLAALRIGYAIGPAERIALLRKLELPFPLGAPQLAAAHAVLDEPERARRAALLLRRERARVAQVFRTLDCAVSESPAPVLLVRHPRLAGRLLYALQAASLPVQESHWDPATFILALGRRGQNDRAIEAARRAVAP